MKNFDFDTEFSKSRNRFNLFFRLILVGVALAGLLAVAQVAAIGYAAVKYGPRYLEAGAKALETSGDK